MKKRKKKRSTASASEIRKTEGYQADGRRGAISFAVERR
jgi:hypothetical protein